MQTMIHKCTHTFAHIMSASFVLKPVCIALVAGQEKAPTHVYFRFRVSLCNVRNINIWNLPTVIISNIFKSYLYTTFKEIILHINKIICTLSNMYLLTSVAEKHCLMFLIYTVAIVIEEYWRNKVWQFVNFKSFQVLFVRLLKLLKIDLFSNPFCLGVYQTTGVYTMAAPE